MKLLQATIDTDLLTRYMDSENDDLDDEEPLEDGVTFTFGVEVEDHVTTLREVCLTFDDDDIPYHVLLVDVPDTDVDDEELIGTLLYRLGGSYGVTRLHWPLHPDWDAS